MSGIVAKWRSFQGFISKTGPFAPLVLFIMFALSIFFLSRVALNVIYFDRVVHEPRFWLMYIIGFRIDFILICYWLSLPVILLFLLPKNAVQHARVFLIFYFTLFIDVAFFMEMATFPFVREYDLRPDSIFVRYLKHVKEVGGTVWATNKWELMITLVLLVIIHRISWRVFKNSLVNYSPFSWKYRLLLFPVLAIAVFLGARSSLAPRPDNISTAYFSENKLVNEFTLNSTFSVFNAIRKLAKEKDPSAFYGHMEESEMFERVKKEMTVPDSAFLTSDIPFLHAQNSGIKRKRPLNVVIVIEESLGAEYVGALGGLNLTPNFDRLSKDGILFTNLYSTGTRTVRGIEAIVSGFLPTPGSSVVNLGLSRSGFFTSGELFKESGYDTEFIYGGQSNFDEMRSFFMGNGFNHIYDEPTFEKAAFKGIWGVSDEDLMRKADQIFRKHGDNPFFAVLLSTSNHSPYEFPDGRISLYEQPKQSVHNSMKYADYAIGLLFELARKSDYYKNTIFLVVADHNTRVFGDEFVPVHKFHIPGLLIGPDIPAKAFNKVASQIDLLPTILHFAGINTRNPMIGRNLMELPDKVPGRAIMQYSNNYGYMVDDTLTVLKPYQPPQTFTYNRKTFKLNPLKVNPEKVKIALAHSLLPWNLYQFKRYHTEKYGNSFQAIGLSFEKK